MRICMETEKTSYVRPRQAAAILSVSPATFWRYTRRPDFPTGLKLSRSATVYVRSEIIAWAQRQPANRKRFEKPEALHDREEEKKQKRDGSARANVRFAYVPLAKGSAPGPQRNRPRGQS